MNILVTNDDGIESLGLHALARRLAEEGDVIVLAPSADVSGASAAIGSIGAELPDVVQVIGGELGPIRAYHFDGTPGLAALLACCGLFDVVPDVVVSGINRGWNVGRSIHFSGTVGACLAAAGFGVPAIAVSQVAAEAGEAQWFETAADVAADMLDDVLSGSRLLNVNVPNRPASGLAGTLETALSDRLPYAMHSPTLTPVSPGRFSATFRRFGPFERPPGTDVHAVEHGYVSVTALSPTHRVR